MALEVIGAGWGRTGTASLKIALEQLGLPCHHMIELFSHPEHSQLFLDAANDANFDWERIYGDYDATVDWPGCAFWRELSATYPDARVLLTVRDPAQWFESYRATIYDPVVNGLPDPKAETWNKMVQRVIVERSMAGEPHDRDRVIAAFQAHNAAVQAETPADRLLVYNVAQGWEPLCAFLDRPVPPEPFPHVNDRASWGKPREWLDRLTPH